MVGTLLDAGAPVKYVKLLYICSSCFLLILLCAIQIYLKSVTLHHLLFLNFQINFLLLNKIFLNLFLREK